jgi:histidinol-phosphate aminotransferase
VTRSLITPLFDSLPAMVPFVGPEAMERQRGRPFRARLGANESVFGPSPKALAAMREAVAANWMYSDPENYELRSAVAHLHGIDAANVVVGEGIDGLLGCAVRLVCEPGEIVVMADGAYPTFGFHVAGQGGVLHKVPFRDDREDLEALLATAGRLGARILYVSNPNNPMGTWWDAASLEALIARLPPGLVLLLDEAYCDTAPAGSVPAIDVANAQVLRLRTFSKAYGLAGARIGYCVGQREMIQAFEKVRNHYGINRVGQIAALAALQDQAYLATAVQQIASARARIAAIGRDNGLAPIASAANFVSIDCGRDGAFARRVLEELIARDVFVRKPAVPPLDRCIRVSCGTAADLDVFAETLPAALHAAGVGA